MHACGTRRRPPIRSRRPMWGTTVRRASWPTEVRDVGGLWLEVRRGSWGRDLSSGSGPGSLGPLAAGAREATIRLPRGRRIEGRVVSTDGRPVGDIQLEAVRVRAEGDPLGPSVQGRESSARDGSFAIDGMDDGEYFIRAAQVPDGLVPPAPTRVRAGAKDVRVVLLSALHARVTVLDSTGKPLEGTQVTADAPGESTPRTSMTDASGVAVVLGLDPHRVWGLRVFPPQGRSDQVPVRRDPWEPRDETIPLASGLTVRGHVFDVSGAPLADLHVWSLDPRASRIAVTDTDGAFQLEGQAAGDVHLLARLADDWENDPPRAEATVPAGAQDVQLLADAGLQLVVRVHGVPAGAHLEWMQLYDAPPDVPEGRGRHPRVKDGVATFVGLKAETLYTLWWPLESRGLAVFDPSGQGGRIPRRAAGRHETLSGYVHLPPGAEDARVVVRLGLAEWPTQCYADGYFELPCASGGHLPSRGARLLPWRGVRGCCRRHGRSRGRDPVGCQVTRLGSRPCGRSETRTDSAPPGPTPM